MGTQPGFGHSKLYAVGSVEDKYFVIDRVISDKDRAIAYSDSRANSKYEWRVYEFEVDDNWFNWDDIHTTERAPV